MTLLVAVGLIATSCINDDIDYSADAILNFSTDTVSFGTLFTGVNSTTARLIVQNRNKKGINISSIRFRDPDTPFRFNVDGVSGSSFSDVEIRGRDSIYVFIECYIDPTTSPQPFRVADRLEFVTNGVTQEVEVEAYAQNVRRLNALKVTSDMTLTDEMPYLITDSLTVESGATLTVSPGTQMLFHDKAYMTVRGTLNAVGATGKMIDMRGDRIDNVLPNVAYDILAGQWGGVRIAPESFGNRMEFVDMRSTEFGLQIDSCADLSRKKLTIVNSWLHNSQGSVLKSVHANVDAFGACFSEAPLAVVSLTGGIHNFVQCTIANNYLFTAVLEPNLMLQYCLPSEPSRGSLPLMEASFNNCIIYGIGSPISPGDLTGSQVFLRNTLLKADGSDDDNFISCIWNEDPLFLTVRSDYYFNYRLAEGSPAIGAGNPAYVTPQCLYDVDGLDRLANGNPDLGAYVYSPGGTNRGKASIIDPSVALRISTLR